MKKYVCLGAGIFNYDIVALKEEKTAKTIIEEVGGTCGNVMCILSQMGWRTYPIARLDESEYGLRLKDDLLSFGCDTSYVTNTADGGTTLLSVVHRTGADGGHKVSVRASGPKGGRFPNYRFIKIDRAKEILETMKFVPDLFFFDSPNAGHRVLAEGLRKKGTLVYFELGNLKDSGVEKCIALSDIVKCSQETIPDMSFAEKHDGKLFIQTMGGDGLRFKLGCNDWVHIPAVQSAEVVDWEGAGDWTTSTFINALAKANALSAASITVDIVSEALKEAQSVAARSISFMGSKGMIREPKTIYSESYKQRQEVLSDK